MSFRYKVICDRDVIEENTFQVVLPPHETAEIKINFTIPSMAENGAFIEIYMDTPNATTWCEAGHALAWAQFELPVEIIPQATPALQRITIEEGKRYITVHSGDCQWSIDLARGMLVSICKNGSEFLMRPSDLVIWRAMIDNDNYEKPKWEAEHFHKTYFKPRTYTTNISDTEYQITFNGALGANSRLPVYDVIICYTITSNGIDIKIDALKNDKLKGMNRSSSEETDLDLNLKTELAEVPRFGMRFALDPDFENFEYFGMGDRECYMDYQNHAKMAVWSSTVSKEYEPYIKPQDCGNHINTKWLTFTDKEGLTFTAQDKFEFSALHYTLEELDKKTHAFELEESKSTEVIISYKNRGVGSASCGPALTEPYQVRDKKIHFGFRIK